MDAVDAVDGVTCENLVSKAVRMARISLNPF